MIITVRSGNKRKHGCPRVVCWLFEMEKDEMNVTVWEVRFMRGWEGGNVDNLVQLLVCPIIIAAAVVCATWFP
jgi:hypothetical protein